MIYYTSHPEKYSEKECYRLAIRIIDKIKKRGRIKTDVYGEDNLPGDDGYIIFSNHQGKYDALGIMAAHKKPCTVVMEDEKSKTVLVKQFIDLIHGKRLKKDDLKQQVKIFDEIAKEVKKGRKYIIFPEAGYDNNQNTLQEFYAGCFRTAIKAKCPIVPTVVWDSYKAFGTNSLKKVKTQVHFLEAIPYSEYEKLNSQELRDLVVEKIASKMELIGAVN